MTARQEIISVLGQHRSALNDYAATAETWSMGAKVYAAEACATGGQNIAAGPMGRAASKRANCIANRHHGRNWMRQGVAKCVK